MSAAPFEFSPQQNTVIGRLAGRMRFVGTALMLLGTVVAGAAALAGAPVSLPGLVAAVVLGLSGYWSQSAGAELRALANTAGADIEHLMVALGRIARVYDLQYWIAVAATVLVIGTVIVA